MKLKRTIVNLLPLILFFIAYYIDHKFAKASMYPIYFIPTLYMSAKWGWPSGAVFSVFGAILSTPISPFIPSASNIVYIDSFATRSITLVTLCILFSNYTTLLRTHKKRNESLKKLIPQCPNCGSILCNDGQWRSLEKLISKPSDFGNTPTHDCRHDQLETKS